MNKASRLYRSLTAARIVETLSLLEKRISERFPESSLRKVATELHGISEEAVVRSDRIRRPNILLRCGIGLLILTLIAVAGAMVRNLRVREELLEFEHFVQSLEATLGSVVFLGAAILFLFSLELRLKRNRAFQALHELRAIAHIVDMHQLTKDPERIVRQGPATPSSPVRTMTTFELGRYLDYCSEMLSMVSKIGALYVQEFPDPPTLEAADQLASLTNGLTRNIWQKIMIIDQMLEDAPPSAPSETPVATVTTPAATKPS